MFSPAWFKVCKRFKKGVARMEHSSPLPSTLKRCLVIGFGFGAGIAFSWFIFKKLSEQHADMCNVAVALNQVAHEIQELRVCLVQQSERTEFSISSEEIVASKERHFRAKAQPRVAKVRETPEEEASSSDEDFFDPREDGSLVSSSESLHEKNLTNVDELIKKCDELSEKAGNDENEKEIEILEDILSTNPSDVEVLWRCARAYKSKADALSGRESGEEKKEVTFKGVEYVKKALEIDDNHASVHKWYAILLGKATEYAALKEKIHLGHLFRVHITKAIELKPDDPTNYHLMGRWCFEVAMLSWWQRQAVSAFVAEPPASSVEEALSYFEKAERFSPGFFKCNSLYLGKCHQNLGDVEKAKEWFEKCLQLPIKDEEDRKAQEEVTSILQSL